MFHRLDNIELMEQKIFEIVLWWCTWGEAGNMRFMPEFISWVFNCLIHHRHKNPGTLEIGRYDDPDDPRGILRTVFRPMFEFLRTEQFRKDKAGNNCDHADKMNCDDINECFWRGKLLQKDDGAHFDPVVRRQDMEELIEKLKKKKTYVERRTILHSVKANLRVFTVYLILFQIIVTVAHFVPFVQDTLPLCPPQLRTDLCASSSTEHSCELQNGCQWTMDRCRDSCNQFDSELTCGTSGTDGCKWSPGGWANANASDRDCNIWTSKSPGKILENIDENTYIGCEYSSGICSYRDKLGVPISYSCLEHLEPSAKEEYHKLNIGEWWELGVSGRWENVPIVGRIISAIGINNDPEGSTLSKNRAAQARMFNPLWSEGNFTRYKQPFLAQQKNRFKCGFDIMYSGVDLQAAANASHCCTIELASPDSVRIIDKSVSYV